MTNEYKNCVAEKVKKREKIVIHYEDGTTEEFTTGMFFTLEEATHENGKKGLRIVAKHCNTRELMEAYVYGLSQVVMAMLDSEDVKRQMFHD